MIFNLKRVFTEPSWEQQQKKKQEWHTFFAILPVQVGITSTGEIVKAQFCFVERRYTGMVSSDGKEVQYRLPNSTTYFETYV